MNNRIVIFGASLVGMTLSYLLHEAGFKNITIIEKRKKYTRQQIVLFRPQIYRSFVPKEVRKKLEECFILPVDAQLQKICKEIKNEDNPFIVNTAIKISDFEKAYFDYIKKFVNVIHSEKTEIDQKNKVVIPQNHSPIPFDILIGADGSNSYVRKVVFDNKIIELLPHNENYGGYFKFEVKKPKNIEPTFFRGLQDFTRGFPQKDQKIYTFNIRLSKKQYNEMKEGKLDTTLFEQIFKIYDLEPKSLVPLDYVVFPINLSRAKQFVKDDTYFLVGDAAITTNFFAGQGANIGIISALHLVNALLSENPKKIYTISMVILSKYSAFVSKLNFFDYQNIMKLCEKYTKKELLEIAEKQESYNRLKGITKEILCLFLTRSIYADYYKQIREEYKSKSLPLSKELIIKKIGGKIQEENYKFQEDFVLWQGHNLLKEHKKLIDVLLAGKVPNEKLTGNMFPVILKNYNQYAKLVNEAFNQKSVIKYVENQVKKLQNVMYSSTLEVAFDIFKKTKNKYDLFVMYSLINPSRLKLLNAT